ncbi:MAG: hypothetical protein F4004_00075 [Acidimicrobiia bacterium]|nr:hypothetical protein [Acidimicrobiia bacterium]MYC44204.1 hypothetical protein [Acidimicrobiia bacterium]
MDRSPRGVRGPRLALLGACAGVFVLLAACGSSGEPADGGSIEQDDVTGRAVAGASDLTSSGYDDATEEHFTRNCERSAVTFGSAPGPVARQYCGCVWDEMVAQIPFEEMLPFLEFLAGVDGEDDDAATLAPAILAIAQDCSDRHAPSPGDYTALVEANFKLSCEASFNDPALRPVAQQACACTWDGIVAEVPFEDFMALEEALRNDPEGDLDPAAASTISAMAAISAACGARHAAD